MNSGIDKKMLKEFCRFLFVLLMAFSPAVQASSGLYVSQLNELSPQKKQAVSVVGLSRTSAVLSPSLRCLAVQANGDVVLSWVLPDTASVSRNFNCYSVYSSNNAAGPYSRIDSIFNYTTTSYTNIGANANGASKYYYVQTRYIGSGLQYSPPIDTLHTIFLTVTNPGNGTAQLNWNPLSNPLPITSLKWYHVYREYPTNVWKQIDSTLSLRFIDTITVCHAFLNYKIEIGDSSGCTSVSNIAGGTFNNIIAPAVVLLDSISVNASGQAQLGWGKDPAPDTKGYIIYKLNGSVWIAVDTVYGNGITSFVPPSSTAGQGSETYGVAAFDSCMNVSVLSDVQKSLFVSHTKDICDMSVLLSWNKYINMPNGLGSYTVIVSLNGGGFQLAGTNPPSDTTYTMPGLIPESTYCFIIVAHDPTGKVTATSNQICYTTTIATQPKFNYLRVATVLVPNTTVKLSAFVDITANAKSYHFYRASSPTATPVHVGSVNTPPASANISLVDNFVDASQGSYYYSMYVVDSCGSERVVSNTARTMWLQAVANDATTSNVLTWNDYSRWLGGVTSYNIYRAIDGVWQVAPIANVAYSSAGTNVYSDNVSAFYSTAGRFEYFIEALEGSGNPYAFADTSHSNVAEALQHATLFIPNAFKPLGIDKIFKPLGTFVDVNDYHFDIFDRWGEKIFSTTDKNAGWDGTISGHPAELGAYVYLISFKTSYGEFVDRKGTVTLLR
jgi:gliding motility-associated-like protein